MVGTAKTLGDSIRLVLRAGWGLPAVLAVLYLINGGLVALELLIIRSVVDDLAAGRSVDAALVLGFAGVAALVRLGPALTGTLQVLVTEGVRKVLLQDVLARASLATLQMLESADYQDRLARAKASASGHVWTVLNGLLMAASAAIASLSVLVVLLTVAPELVLLLTAAGLLMAVVAIIRGRWQYRLEFDDTEIGRERRYLEDALVSPTEGQEIRLVGGGRILLDRYRALTERRHSELTAVVWRHVGGSILTTLGLAIALGLSLIVVSNRAAAGSILLADAAVAVFAANQLATRLQVIATGFGTVMQARLFVNDIQTFLESPEGETERSLAARRSGEGVVSLLVDDVSFTYPGTDHPAIEHVSFRLDQGEIVALVGGNGAGKTTLAKVAAGLYQPSSGSVQITGGTPAATAAQQPPVAGLFQDFARYELSVRENVWLGAPWRDPEDAAIAEAIEMAGASDFIANLPLGVDTRLGKRFEGGFELSLGQWQRLALARAVFSDAPLIILDEPTAWLDAESVEAFAELVARLAENRGVLLISHRAETLDLADRQLHLRRPDRRSPSVLVEDGRPSSADGS